MENLSAEAQSNTARDCRGAPPTAGGAAVDVTIERVAVVDTQPHASGAFGTGLAFESGVSSGAPTVATVSQSRIARNHGTGVLLWGADATLTGMVVSDTLPQASDLLLGNGINLQRDPNTPTVGTITSSVIERNRSFGVASGGVEAHLVGVVVRDTFPRASNLGGGMGLLLGDDLGGAAAGSVTTLWRVVSLRASVGRTQLAPREEACKGSP